MIQGSGLAVPPLPPLWVGIPSHGGEGGGPSNPGPNPWGEAGPINPGTLDIGQVPEISQTRPELQKWSPKM